MKKYCVLTILIISGHFISAQTLTHIRGSKDKRTITQIYEDSLFAIKNKYFPLLDSLNNDTLPERYIELNPRYFKLFIPLTFYRSPIKQAFELKWKVRELKEIQYPTDSLFPVDWKLFTQSRDIRKRVNSTLLNTYLKYPELVTSTEDRISRRRLFKDEVVEELPPKTKVIDLFQPEIIETKVVDVDYHVRKPNFWVFKGNGSLQFTQNYISDNWYKGGESTNSMLSQLQLDVNYDDKERLEFDNRLEIKLGFITAPSDTVHKYKPNSDLLRLTSKVGIKAINRWYYTFSTEFNTQFFSNYKTNTNDKQSAFLSPANLLFSLGMDYKLNKKKINLSIFVSPITYNFRYIHSDEVDPTAFGIEKGKNTLSDFGSKLQTNMKWTIIPSIIWESRLSYFTNYEKVEAEWENTFNFVLNRYLSTKLFIHGRFDDGVSRKEDQSYFQLKELLSFGINYQW